MEPETASAERPTNDANGAPEGPMVFLVVYDEEHEPTYEACATQGLAESRVEAWARKRWDELRVGVPFPAFVGTALEWLSECGIHAKVVPLPFLFTAPQEVSQ